MSRVNYSMENIVKIFVKGLMNCGSSCYIDCVIFALLYLPNRFIEDNILRYQTDNIQVNNIRKELKKLHRKITMKKKSSNNQHKFPNSYRLIELLKEIPRYPFNDSKEQDAVEFLLFILQLFNIKGSVIHNVTYGTNDIVNKIENIKPGKLFKLERNVDVKGSIVNFIDSFSIKDNLSLSDMLSRKTDNIVEDYKFNRVISLNTVKYIPDYYIFAVQRADPLTNKILKNPVRIPDIIRVQFIVLELTSVILYIGDKISGGHYICYFKYNDEWLIYDDMIPSMIRLPSLINNEYPNPETHGVLYFYTFT